jgi:hypothetical protein
MFMGGAAFVAGIEIGEAAPAALLIGAALFAVCGRAVADAVAIAAAPISISLRLTPMVDSENLDWITPNYTPFIQIGTDARAWIALSTGSQAPSVALWECTQRFGLAAADEKGHSAADT